MHRPDVWLQTTPVILDQRQRLASKGRPCMEDACSRMECGKDAICRGVRRSVRGQSLNQLGSAHKISDSPVAEPLLIRIQPPVPQRTLQPTQGYYSPKPILSGTRFPGSTTRRAK